jgi:hypothetical protein
MGIGKCNDVLDSNGKRMTKSDTNKKEKEEIIAIGELGAVTLSNYCVNCYRKKHDYRACFIYK